MEYPDPPMSADDVPDDLIEAWAAAWSHDGIIDAIWYGEWPCCHELTTGCTCRGYDTGSSFAWISRGCAMHSPELEHLKLRPTRPDPPMRACCCLYGVRRVQGAPGPYAIVNMTARYRRHEWGVWAFKIHPRCPHHGDPVHARGGWRPPTVIVDEWPAWVTLDDQERRGD